MASAVPVHTPSLPGDAELGERLRWFRKLHRRTRAEVAEALGMPESVITAIEAGQRHIDARLLGELADAYGADLTDLVRPPAPTPGLHDQFRIPPGLDEAERGQLVTAIAALETFVGSYRHLEGLLDRPLRARTVPHYAYDAERLEADAERIADAERQRMGIGNGPVYRLRDILEREAGMRTFHLDLPGNIAALYGLSDSAGPCVAINARHLPVQQRWALAHVLGHLAARLDGVEVTRLATGEPPAGHERFAERFAAAFLVPAAGLEPRISDLRSGRQQVSVADLLLIAGEYEVSLEALVLRLEGLGPMPEGAWEREVRPHAEVRITSRDLGIPLPSGDTLTYPRRFIYLALDAYDRALLSEGELMHLLQTDRLAVRGIAEEFSAGTQPEGDLWPLPLSTSVSLTERW